MLTTRPHQHLMLVGRLHRPAVSVYSCVTCEVRGIPYLLQHLVSYFIHCFLQAPSLLLTLRTIVKISKYKDDNWLQHVQYCTSYTLTRARAHTHTHTHTHTDTRTHSTADNTTTMQLLVSEAFEVVHLFIDAAFQVQVDAVVVVGWRVSAQLQSAVFQLQVNKQRSSSSSHHTTRASTQYTHTHTTHVDINHTQATSTRANKLPSTTFNKHCSGLILCLNWKTYAVVSICTPMLGLPACLVATKYIQTVCT